MGHGVAVIDVAGGHVESEQLTAVIDHSMQFKAVKPAHGGFPPPGDFSEHLMAVDAPIVANGDGRGVNKGHTRGLTFTLP